MKKTALILAAAAALFAAWNWGFGKRRRPNSAYPDNWDSLSALDQLAYERAYVRGADALIDNLAGPYE